MPNFNDLTREQLVTLRDRYLELINEEIELFGVKPTELRHLIGRLGELQCILDTNGKISNSANQKGFDVVGSNGRRISVKATAQKSGFVNISKSTCDLVDDLCVYQFADGVLTLIYRGPLESVLPLCLPSQDGKKHELSLSKLRKL